MHIKVLAHMASCNSLSEDVNYCRNPCDSSSIPFKTNWSLCIFCQESTNERVTCPAESKRQDSEVGYSTLASDLIGFNEIGKLPETEPP